MRVIHVTCMICDGSSGTPGLYTEQILVYGQLQTEQCVMQVARHAGIARGNFAAVWTFLLVMAVPLRAHMDSHVASCSRAGHAVVGYKPDRSAAQGVSASVQLCGLIMVIVEICFCKTDPRSGIASGLQGAKSFDLLDAHG